MKQKSTPRKARDHVVQADSIAATRATVIREIGSIPRFPIGNFQGTVLPAVSPTELQNVKSSLDIGDSSREWISQHMGCVRPSKSTVHEGHTFAKLTDVFSKVAVAVSELGIADPRVRMEDNPNRAPRGTVPFATRPDACFVVKDSTTEWNMTPRVDTERFDDQRESPENISWTAIAGTKEYKKIESDLSFRDNAAKVILNMCQVMAFDPCRRSTFAFTYEDTTVRFWWCDRSGFAVSEEFDYFVEFDKLLEIYIALCKASDADLGFDPSITRIDVEGKEQFWIEVSGTGLRGETVTECYQTLQCLSNVGADRVLGRAMRVWKVRLRDPVTNCLIGDPKVLKDFWMEGTRKTEGDHYRRIFQWFEEHPEHADYRRHFLTLRVEGPVTTNGESDSTFKSIRKGSLMGSFDQQTGIYNDDTLILIEESASLTSVMSGSVGGVGDIGKSLQRRMASSPVDRIHFRGVVEEVGVRIDHLSDLKQVFTGIQGANRGAAGNQFSAISPFTEQIFLALTVLQWIGLVHRDVSIGNILLVEEFGVLSDFEYMVTYIRAAGCEPHRHELSGTAHFMSSELHGGGVYLWGVDQPQRPEFRVAPSPAYFHQNYLHDAEALWWVCLWFLVWTLPSAVPVDGAETLAWGAAQATRALSCFPIENVRVIRSSLSNPFHDFSAYYNIYQPPTSPAAYLKLFETHHKLRWAVIQVYKLAEPFKLQFVPEEMDDLHLNLQPTYEEFVKNTDGHDMFIAYWEREIPI